MGAMAFMVEPTRFYGFAVAACNLSERSEQHPFAEYGSRTFGEPQGSTNSLLRIPLAITP